MSKILAVGGPKGGVGKSTVALRIAENACRRLGLDVLLVDADPNRSALDHALAAGDSMPLTVSEGYDHDQLVRLHNGTTHDLVVVDLPGAREVGALRALLSGGKNNRGKPAFDLLVMPTPPDIMDLRPLIRAVKDEIAPTGIAYLVCVVRAQRDRLGFSTGRRDELRAMGIRTADTVTRDLMAHRDSVELAKPLMDLPGGKRSGTRAADREYAALTAEALGALGFDVTALKIEEGF
jgi:CobQ/CobB/MinD/ParA family nucleotide binding protein